MFQLPTSFPLVLTTTHSGLETDVIAVQRNMAGFVGAYPDGIAFAVLLGNLMVPLLDKLELAPR